MPVPTNVAPVDNVLATLAPLLSANGFSTPDVGSTAPVHTFTSSSTGVPTWIPPAFVNPEGWHPAKFIRRAERVDRSSEMTSTHAPQKPRSTTVKPLRPAGKCTGLPGTALYNHQVRMGTCRG